MDDCLKSVEHEEVAVSLVQDLISLCKKGGFKLAKWVSNSRQVLKAVHCEDKVNEEKRAKLDLDESPAERALRVCWKPDTDVLEFDVKCGPEVVSRRTMLSRVSAIYDPLGLASPFILPAKVILQDLCRKNLG